MGGGRQKKDFEEAVATWLRRRSGCVLASFLHRPGLFLVSQSSLIGAALAQGQAAGREVTVGLWPDEPECGQRPGDLLDESGGEVAVVAGLGKIQPSLAEKESRLLLSALSCQVFRPHRVAYTALQPKTRRVALPDCFHFVCTSGVPQNRLGIARGCANFLGENPNEGRKEYGER